MVGAWCCFGSLVVLYIEDKFNQKVSSRYIAGFRKEALLPVRRIFKDSNYGKSSTYLYSKKMTIYTPFFFGIEPGF